MKKRASKPSLAIVLVLCSALACAPQTSTEEVDFRVPVSAREAGTGTVENAIVATGTLRASEIATLSVETEGVLSLARGPSGKRYGEGDRVRAGDLIAEITGEDVRVAARLDATRQRLAAAERDHESKKALFAEGLITRLDLLQAESALEDARSEYDRSVLTETRTRLTTPIAGVIVKQARDAQGQPIADGQRVTPGLVVAEIAPVDRLIADIDVVGDDVLAVAPGLPARVRHHAFGDALADGRVLRIAPTQNAATRATRIECEVANADGLLRPGMFVEVTIVVETRADVTVVPREAVTERDGRTVVFVVEGQKAFQRPVVLGLGDDRIVEIREGLARGERVVVRGLETLTDGTRVQESGE